MCLTCALHASRIVSVRDEYAEKLRSEEDKVLRKLRELEEKLRELEARLK